MKACKKKQNSKRTANEKQLEDKSQTMWKIYESGKAEGTKQSKTLPQLDASGSYCRNILGRVECKWVNQKLNKKFDSRIKK